MGSLRRPIGLLDSLGKLYEPVIRGRLDREIEITGGWHREQYGFRKGKSTVEATHEILQYARAANSPGEWTAVVCLDVKNTFNSAPWGKIMQTLAIRKIDSQLYKVIGSYLRN